LSFQFQGTMSGGFANFRNGDYASRWRTTTQFVGERFGDNASTEGIADDNGVYQELEDLTQQPNMSTL
jgi:hypothetical protein